MLAGTTVFAAEKYLITEAGRIQITQETRGYAAGFLKSSIM